MAFPKSEEARLMVKISGAKEHPEDLVSIRALIGERPDIILILDRLDAERMSDLFARCDILISLHRSEGFGLPIAEAMAAGKAVIATAWSGNLDFMPLIEVQRVPATVTSVDDAPGIYVDQVWADPDMDRAAASMRRLAQDTVLRRACGAANREAIAMIRFHWDRQALDTRPFARYVSA
jgi:glycosyltransferase involved in cell wall biosynthesis